MQWWNDFLDWFNSDDGWRIVSGALLPFVAIIVAGIIAALIGRGSAKRVIALSDREVRVSAVTALISAARKAAVWNSLPAPEQVHIEHLSSEADIRLRMLPVYGTALAADWAQHEIADMKKNAVSFSFQAEQSLLVFRDRLVEWQHHPGRAKRLFRNDLDSWAYDSSLSEQELVHNQQAWAAQQVTETGPLETVKTNLFSRPGVAAQAPVATAPVAPASVASASVTSAPVASAALSAPPYSAPAVSAPAVAAPAVTSPAVTSPAVTAPAVAAPVAVAAPATSMATGLPALVEPKPDTSTEAATNPEQAHVTGEQSFFDPAPASAATKRLDALEDERD